MRLIILAASFVEVNKRHAVGVIKIERVSNSLFDFIILYIYVPSKVTINRICKFDRETMNNILTNLKNAK